MKYNTVVDASVHLTGLKLLQTYQDQHIYIDKFSLPGRNTVQLRDSPIFQRNTPPPSSGSKCKPKYKTIKSSQQNQLGGFYVWLTL
jgi:hypothetical protein